MIFSINFLKSLEKIMSLVILVGGDDVSSSLDPSEFSIFSKSLSLPLCRLPSSKGPPRGAQKAESSVVHIPKISKVPRSAFFTTITFKGPDHIYISFSGCSKTLSTYPEKIFELFAEPFRGNFHSF